MKEFVWVIITDAGVRDFGVSLCFEVSDINKGIHQASMKHLKIGQGLG